MKRLRLALEPDRPARVSRHSRSRTAGRGYRLVLDGSTPLSQEDPLLEAFGARVLSVVHEDEHLDALQDDAFAPGRELSLELRPWPEDRNRIVVADAAGLLPVGVIPAAHAPRLAAAIEHGVELSALVITERLHLARGERVGLRVLVAPVAFVAVRRSRRQPARVERLPERRRVVLAVERDGSLRWWDPVTAAPPLDLADLPISADLTDELRDLESSWQELLDPDPDDDDEFYDDWTRGELEKRSRAVWRSVRRELESSYVVGWKPPRAPRAIYTDAPAHETDDIPF